MTAAQERAALRADAYMRAATIGGTAGALAAADWIAGGAPEDERPEPDLSGEWADTLTGPVLYALAYGSVVIGEDGAPLAVIAEPFGDDFSEVCGAYEDAYRDAVTQAEAGA